MLIDSEQNKLFSKRLLNLTHHKSYEDPQLLSIDQIYIIEITLSPVCVCLPVGSRLRLCLSTSYWPIVWPSPQLSTLTIHLNELSSPCFLSLPCLDENYAKRNDFERPEICQGLDIKNLRNSSINRSRSIDEINEIITLKINEDNRSIEYPDGLIWDETSESIYIIKKNQPQSAKIEIKRFLKYYYKDQSFLKVNIETKSIMFSKESPSTFEIEHQLNIHNKDNEIFNKHWNLSFPRIIH